MISERTHAILLVGACLLILAGCGGFGRVSQGRVIEYDPAKRTVTLILEPDRGGQAAAVGVLPPRPVALPDDPRSMGPAPTAGKLMALDTQGWKATFYDSATQSFKSVTLSPVEQKEGVAANHPSVKGAVFPRIDRTQQTVTLYLAARRHLVTFKVPEEYLALPPDTWETGDEVRYYYKDPHKALRLMNVTKTGIL